MQCRQVSQSPTLIQRVGVYQAGMSQVRVLSIAELPRGSKKVVKIRKTEILLINHSDAVYAVQSKCPHAGAPLAEGAVCNGRLTCPWHLGTFALANGELLEPPAMEPLNTYSVKLQGQDIIVDPTPLPHFQPPAHRQTAQSVILLVGSGAAGAAAATTLRQNGFAGTIVAVDPVEDEPVDRTQLSKDALSGKFPLDEVGIEPFRSLYVDRRIASVIELNSTRRQVRLDTGDVVNFDKALIATGGKPKRLPIPGAELAHTIRHPADVRRILNTAKTARKVAIIGTSFIGFEAASALVQLGPEVTVIGSEKDPFAKQFGKEVACALKKLHESNGTQFRLGVEPIQISPTHVTISERGAEAKMAADLVIMGVGVNPELSFIHDLPVAKQGGIATDDSLRVADSVWVAGDIAQVTGQRIEHWRVAQQHGRIAALSMLGQDATYEGVPFFWTYHFGKRLGYLGHAVDWDETFVKGDLAGKEYMVFYLKNDIVHAVLNCGFETQLAALSEPMRSKLTLPAALRLLS